MVRTKITREEDPFVSDSATDEAPSGCVVSTADFGGECQRTLSHPVYRLHTQER